MESPGAALAAGKKGDAGGAQEEAAAAELADGEDEDAGDDGSALLLALTEASAVDTADRSGLITRANRLCELHLTSTSARCSRGLFAGCSCPP